MTGVDTPRALEPTIADRAVAARRRRVSRPWLVLLGAYAIVLTASTHWPNLQLGTPEAPVSDKMLHAGAFAAATVLLWLAGIARRPLPLMLLGLGWAALDELTQAIPLLGRTISWLDLLASGVGVVVVAAFAWATGPVGGAAARRGQARALWSLEETLAAWPRILLVGAGAALLGLVGGLIGERVFSLPRIERPVDGWIAGGILGIAAGAHMTLEILRRRWLRRAPRRCFACDAAAPAAEDPAWEAGGEHRCAGCAAPLHAAQWDPPPTVRGVSAGGIVAVALGTALLLVGLSFVVSLLASGLRLRSGLVARLDDAYRLATYDMRLVVETLWIGLLGAAGLRAVRWHLARRLDRQRERCVACGFDLRATETSGGRGTCPECGTRFGEE